uniref:transcriptional corepressor SEUSS-like n=1 Tax=Erigeron canadensis TaxID=72917 RepID=UPI001CB97B1B|nr:transcriptional corepressor SEUSS-like [Erigeron canadensis]
MVPSGQPTPLAGAQSVPSSMLRSNSVLLGGSGGGGGQGGGSQSGFPSLVSPRNQFNNNMNMIGNVSSLLQQSYGNGGGGPNSGPGTSLIRGIIDSGATESDPLSNIGNGMGGFNTPSSSSLGPSNLVNANEPGQHFSNSSTNQIMPDQQQQRESPNLRQSQQQQQQYSVLNNNHQQQQYQTSPSGSGHVKMEPRVSNDQNSQQMQALRNLGQVKMESQQVQTMKNLPSIKIEPQHSDPSLFLHQQQQQQQQQQLLHMSRQSPQASSAQMNLLHQQRFLQLQQQQQLLKSIPQQRPSIQSQFQQQHLAVRSSAKPVYEPGMCARRLTHYMYQQQHRPEDNNIEFWRKFVAEYFAPNARKKWCVSLYGNGRHTTGVFPQDVWHCEICNKKPGRGFEATVEVLPRLFKIKYESGTLEELLYVDMPREYQNSSGQIVLDYAKAIQESVFEQLRVVRDGQLRIVFSADLKICSWEFCARRHEELIPRRLLIPQVNQLGNAAQKYQASTQNVSSSLSVPELQNNCNMFVASARQLAKALEVPLVNDLGYTKRYVRCLQISEVVNSMKDLIDYSRETRTGPMESLAKFPRKMSSTSRFHSQPQQPDELKKHNQQLQTVVQTASNNETSAMQIASTNGMMPNVNNSNCVPPTSSNSTIVGLLHQNSMNSRHQNPLITNTNGHYGGGTGGIQIQIPSPGSSSTVPQPQPFQSPTASISNNVPQSSHNSGMAASGAHLNSTTSPNVSMSDADASDSQSSVQKIIQEMMMSSQLGGGGGGGGVGGVGSVGFEMKNSNDLIQERNNSGLVGNGIMGGGGLGQMGMVNGMRGVMGHNNSLSMNGRVAMQMLNHHQQQQDLGSQLLNGLGSVNGFNNLPFDWKPSP